MSGRKTSRGCTSTPVSEPRARQNSPSTRWRTSSATAQNSSMRRGARRARKYVQTSDAPARLWPRGGRAAPALERRAHGGGAHGPDAEVTLEVQVGRDGEPSEPAGAAQQALRDLDHTSAARARAQNDGEQLGVGQVLGA